MTNRGVYEYTDIKYNVLLKRPEEEDYEKGLKKKRKVKTRKEGRKDGRKKGMKNSRKERGKRGRKLWQQDRNTTFLYGKTSNDFQFVRSVFLCWKSSRSAFRS